MELWLPLYPHESTLVSLCDLCRRQVKCTYSDYSNSPDYSSSPIDVVAEVKSQKVSICSS
jgi:hypothetical protein